MYKMFEGNKLSLYLNTLLLIFFGTLLGSCSSSRSLVGTPNLVLRDKEFLLTGSSQEVQPKIIYVTDRRLELKNKKEFYSTERSSSMAYGTAKVGFSGVSDWSDLKIASSKASRKKNIELSLLDIKENARFPETPIPFKIISGKVEEDQELKNRYSQVRGEFRSLLENRLEAAAQKEIIIYIHGFNTSFDEAALNLTEIWHFSGRHGVPILYSWPAGVGGLFGYFKDRESGEFTIYHLKEFLRVLRDIKSIEKVHIIAHSRGTDIMTSALRELIIESRAAGKDPFTEYRIENLILAAPDLDFEVVRQRLMAERFALGIGQINIYTSSADGALGIAQRLMSGIRFGMLKKNNLATNETKIFNSIKRVSFINVSGTKGFFGHSYYREHPGALSDIIQVIKTGGHPGSPKRPLIHKGGRFWNLEEDYLLK